MLRLSFLLLAFAQSSLSHAFMNVESLRQTAKKGWHGSGSVKGSDSRGNTDTSTVKLQSLNILKDETSELILALNYGYGEANQVKNANEGRLHLRYATGFVESLLMLEFFLQEEFNEFQLLELRQVYGSGLRLRGAESKSFQLYFGLGGFLEDEDLNQPPDQNAFRWNSYASLRYLLSEQSNLYSTVYLQPNSRTLADYRLRFNLGLQFQLVDAVSFTAEWRWAEDTRPPDQVEKVDALTLLGLNWSY